MDLGDGKDKGRAVTPNMTELRFSRALLNGKLQYLSDSLLVQSNFLAIDFVHDKPFGDESSTQNHTHWETYCSI